MMDTAFQNLCNNARVIPVIEIDDVGTAEDLAGALIRGGIGVIELTLRTRAALPAMQVMKALYPNLVVGMGTIVNADNARRAADHGADFLVSPGFTHCLAETAKELALPFLPGIATPGDIIRARDHGYSFLKFFPAEAAGGVPYLNALSGPFSGVVYCPTGGIGADQAIEYLRLPSVVCVGGSWVASRAMIKAYDWKTVEQNARKAVALRVSKMV